MVKKVTHFPVTLMLTAGAVLLFCALLFFLAAGVLVGVFKEVFKFYSRGIDTENSDYQMETGNLKSEVRKMFNFNYTQASRTVK